MWVFELLERIFCCGLKFEGRGSTQMEKGRSIRVLEFLEMVR